MKTIIILSLFLMFISGCTSRNTWSPEAEKVFNTYTTTDLVTLDPQYIFDHWSAEICMQIFDTLIEYDLTTLKIKGCLAESWEYEKGGKKIVFHLREDVHFHDDPCFPDGKGRKMTAHDVKYSFERNHSKTAIGLQFITSIKGYDVNNIPDMVSELEGIKVKDDFTLEIEFVNPNSTFLQTLTRTFGFIVPKEAVEYYGDDFGSHPVGTGPFRITRIEKNGDIILNRNNNYWGTDDMGKRLPYLDGIVFSLMKIPVVRLTKFSTGELDVLDVDSENYSVIFRDLDLTLNKYYKDMDCKLAASEYPFVTNWLIFTPEEWFAESNANIDNVKALWSEKRIREAICYSIDRERIVNDIIGSWKAIPAHGEFPPGLDSYDPDFKFYEYNPEKAVQLLKEAGFPRGKGLKPFKIVVPEGIVKSLVANAVKKDLEAIGIESTVYSVPYGEKTPFVKRIGAELNMDNWALEYPDAMNIFEPSAIDTPVEMTKNIYFEFIESKRNELLKEWEKFYVNKVAKVYLFHEKSAVRITHKNIENYVFSPMSYDLLKYVRKN